MDLWRMSASDSVEGVAALLSESDALVDDYDECGATPLHMCASNGSMDVARLLISRGADVNLPDKESGWTPLHRAIYNGHVRMALLLIRHGAVLGDELSIGRPWQSKRDRGRQSDATAHNKTVDFDGHTPLSLASQQLRGPLCAAQRTGVGGEVYSFGKADFQLGYAPPNSASVDRARRVLALAHHQVVYVAAARFHSVAVTRDGRVYTWGHGTGGRLGHGDEHTRMTPCRVDHPAIRSVRIAGAAAGENHTLVVSDRGAVFAWGSDRFGQLALSGAGSSTSSRSDGSGGVAGGGERDSGSTLKLSPRRVEALRKLPVASLSTSACHTVAVMRDGSLYAWGCNKSGQLGRKRHNQSSQSQSSSNSSMPRPVPGFGSSYDYFAVAASAGPVSTLVLAFPNQPGARGVARTRGSGSAMALHGFLRNDLSLDEDGFDSDEDEDEDGAASSSTSARARHHHRGPASFVNMHELDVAAAVRGDLRARARMAAAGAVHDVFQFGHGSPSPMKVHFPRLNSGQRLDIIAVSAGRHHSVALSSSGCVFTWGRGADSLGLGAQETHAASPQLVESLLPEQGGGYAVQVMASEHRTCVVTEAGDLFTWGHTSDQGVLGHGSGGRFSPKPMRVTGIKRAVRVAAAPDHTIVLSSAFRPPKPHASATTPSCPLSLHQLCERAMADLVDVENVVSLTSFAELHNSPGLAAFCVDFIKLNLDAVLVLTASKYTDMLIDESMIGDHVKALLGASSSSGGGTRKAGLQSHSAPSGVLSACVSSASSSSFPSTPASSSAAAAVAAAVGAPRSPGVASTRDLASMSIQDLSRAVRGVRKKLKSIAELERSIEVGGLEVKDMGSDVRAKLRRKPELEAELVLLEPFLEAEQERQHRLEEREKEKQREKEAEMKETAKAARTGASPTSTPDGTHGQASQPGTIALMPQEEGLSSSPNGPSPRNDDPWYCPVCDVIFHNGKSFDAHVKSKRHRTRLKRTNRDALDVLSIMMSRLRDEGVQQAVAKKKTKKAGNGKQGVQSLPPPAQEASPQPPAPQLPSSEAHSDPGSDPVWGDKKAQSQSLMDILREEEEALKQQQQEQQQRRQKAVAHERQRSGTWGPPPSASSKPWGFPAQKSVTLVDTFPALGQSLPTVGTPPKINPKAPSPSAKPATPGRPSPGPTPSSSPPSLSPLPSRSTSVQTPSHAPHVVEASSEDNGAPKAPGLSLMDFVVNKKSRAMVAPTTGPKGPVWKQKKQKGCGRAQSLAAIQAEEEKLRATSNDLHTDAWFINRQVAPSSLNDIQAEELTQKLLREEAAAEENEKQKQKGANEQRRQRRKGNKEVQEAGEAKEQTPKRKGTGKFKKKKGGNGAEGASMAGQNQQQQQHVKQKPQSRRGQEGKGKKAQGKPEGRSRSGGGGGDSGGACVKAEIRGVTVSTATASVMNAGAHEWVPHGQGDGGL